MISLFEFSALPYFTYFGLIMIAFLSKPLYKSLHKYDLDDNKRFKCVIYLIEIILFPYLVIIFALLYKPVIKTEYSLDDYTQMSKYMGILIQSILVMYTFELSYDHKMNKTLIIHHLGTLFFSFIGMKMIIIYPIRNVIIATVTSALYFTTDAPVYLMMLDYRIRILNLSMLTKRLLITYYAISRYSVGITIYYYCYQSYHSGNSDEYFIKLLSIGVAINTILLIVQTNVIRIYLTIMHKSSSKTTTTTNERIEQHA